MDERGGAAPSLWCGTKFNAPFSSGGRGRARSGDVDGHLCSDLFQGKEETRKREDGMLDGQN